MNKIVSSFKEIFEKCGLKDGMTISFHHHLRNGDFVCNEVLRQIDECGYKDLKLAHSSVFPCNEPIIKYMENGTITSLDTGYMSGPVADYISEGKFKGKLTMRSHGGRAKAIAEGEIKIDIAFIAAPCCDNMGNMNGIYGASAFGSMGYAFPDARYAQNVVAITDNLVPYPNPVTSIDETNVDYVVVMDRIGDPDRIVSGTTKITKDPVGLKIAENAANAIEHSGLFKDGFSFQTGAGGASLAAAYYLKQKLIKSGIKGSYALGGITKYMVEFLEEGLFTDILDVQCFDLGAVESMRKNARHKEIASDRYASCATKSCAVDSLDVVILGATEIDVNFNVNVTTDSTGRIIGGSGGHNDAAAGAKMTIIVAPLVRARLPIILDEVTTKTTPGNTIDVLVTERGIAVNPLRPDLKERFLQAKLPVYDIKELKAIAEAMTGEYKRPKHSDVIVGDVLYRDSTLIDHLYKIQ